MWLSPRFDLFCLIYVSWLRWVVAPRGCSKVRAPSSVLHGWCAEMEEGIPTRLKPARGRGREAEAEALGLPRGGWMAFGREGRTTESWTSARKNKSRSAKQVLRFAKHDPFQKG